jgi:hypothetical protein
MSKSNGARQSVSRRVGSSRPKTQSKVNAKANTKIGAVKVKAAKGFRFGGSRVARTEAAFA